MREFIALLHECQSGAKVTFAGDYYQVRGFRLGVELGGCRRRSRRPSGRPPSGRYDAPSDPAGAGGQLRIFRLGDPPQRRQSSVSPAGFLSRLLSGVEVGGHGGWGKGGAVDGDVGEAAGEEITAALQHPGP